MYVCVCVCVCVCAYVCEGVCMCVCLCMNVYGGMHVHFVYVRALVCPYECMCKDMSDNVGKRDYTCIGAYPRVNDYTSSL